MTTKTVLTNTDLRNKIGSLMMGTDPLSDNLAIALCTYFELHPSCPKDDEQTEHGWHPWAEGEANRILSEITRLADTRLVPPARAVGDETETLCSSPRCASGCEAASDVRVDTTKANFKPFYILANVRRLLPRYGAGRLENWVLARDVFAVGSTTARAICEEAGIDPDSTETRIEPSAEKGESV